MILKLPAKLVDELGGQDVLSADKKTRVARDSRKEHRKAERFQKKAFKSGPPVPKPAQIYHPQSFDEGYQKQPPTDSLKSEKLEKTSKPRSILKQTKRTDPAEPRSGSTLPPPRISRAVKDKLAEEDEEIAALERKLGFKGRNGLPQSFKEDGLGELLEGLDEGGDPDFDYAPKKKRKAEADEWLDRKRRKAQLSRRRDLDIQEEDEDIDGSGTSGDDASDMISGGLNFSGDVPDQDSANLENNNALHEDNDVEGSNPDGDNEDAGASAPRVRENPFVAPVVDGTAVPSKYLPPSLRKSSSSESEVLIRLRRQLQGLVNRLTESNLVSITGDIEKIYRDNPRQHVTSTLIDLLLISICEPTSLPDTLIILLAGFISAIYKIIGTDFGAQVVERIVKLFGEQYSRANKAEDTGPAAPKSGTSKETSNLIMLLSEMYNFQVVGSMLVFDYIRLFLEELSELTTELLLKIIRASGRQLRQDDPSALKGIVGILGSATASIGEQNLSVRMKFMIETINNLKNNKMKAGSVASAVTSEHTIRMKKILGTLNTRSVKGSEPLRIGLKDIQNSDKKGKWWLVGASWAGEVEGKKVFTSDLSKVVKRLENQDSGTSDLAQLAREQGMNTAIRIAIFMAIMSASDYQDAYLRLMKLPLKRKQEYEIPKVLIICSGAEKSYNPYYTLIAKQLCGSSKMKKSFQFSLWDIFKQMGELDDARGEQEEESNSILDTRHVVNLAKLFGSLIADGGLGLGILKNLNLSYLQPKTTIFMEVLFNTVLLQSQNSSESKRDEQAVVNILMKVGDTPQLITGMQYFLKKAVSKTDIAGGKEAKRTVKWACGIARVTLESLAALNSAK